MILLIVVLKMISIPVMMNLVIVWLLVIRLPAVGVGWSSLLAPG